MTPLDAANAIVRAWTRLYTWRLPAFTRDLRRGEIDSDLWEFEHDSERDGGTVHAIHVLTRLVRGIPDDVSWRAAQLTVGIIGLRAVISIAAAAVAVSLLWIYTTTRVVDLPAPAPLVRVDLYAEPPPPPPPPPPPRRSLERTP